MAARTGGEVAELTWGGAVERRRVYPRRERGSHVEQSAQPGDLLSLGPNTVPEAAEVGFGIEIIARPEQQRSGRTPRASELGVGGTTYSAGPRPGGAGGGGLVAGQVGTFAPLPHPQEVAEPRTLVRQLETALREGDLDREKWKAWEAQARECCHLMDLDQLLRTLRCFVLGIPPFRIEELLFTLAAEAVSKVQGAGSALLVQLLHWMSRAGLRDAALAHVVGNEILLRVSDNFVTEMILEVLNALAQLDIRHPRLAQELIREVSPSFPDFTREQCLQCSPLMILQVLTDSARMELLRRFADLNLCVPAAGHKEAPVRAMRLLEIGLRTEHRQPQIPTKVLEWMSRIRNEAEQQSPVGDAAIKSALKQAPPLSRTEKDIFRVVVERLKLPCEPVVHTGLFLLHLVVGAREAGQARHVIEVQSPDSCFRTTHATHRGLLRPDVKFRQKLLWRNGWKVVQLNEDEWWELNDEQKVAKVQAGLDAGHRKTMMAPLQLAQ